MKHLTFLVVFFSISHVHLSAQKSVALQWNEILLEGIRSDFARPTVHSRNLFHCSVAMYDAWAVYDTIARPLFLGDTLGEYIFDFEEFPIPEDVESARNEAISFAMYRMLRHRFLTSPGAWEMYLATDSLLLELGYDKGNASEDYQSGSPAALGNYIAGQIINFGIQDGANEMLGYENTYYEPVNDPLIMDLPGNPEIIDPNKWQPLTLDIFIDQSGNVIPFNTPEFLGPEWGNVEPFAMTLEDLTTYQTNGNDFRVFQDPGPPFLIQEGLGMDDPYKWGFALVSVWSSHLGKKNDTLIDISPASIGNLDELPTNFEEYRQFYQLEKGGDSSKGHDINPFTGESYASNMVSRSDYGRVLAEFWADGPESETPPGHWYTLLNYVNANPLLVKRFEGKGPILDDLEWDVKTYLALGGAMHDCAVTAWGIKGYYDYIRPVSAIRYMAEKGQSASEELPNYHPHGFPLLEGYIELVEVGDELAGPQGQNVNEIKILAWKGPNYIADPDTTVADVDWILAKNWWPYQRPSFVTPPFAGYISGHSTFSRAAADLLAQLTGDPFFPGGIAEFRAEKDSFLVFEDGPSQDVVLQWATYRDASDQTSLSRIWGGIHPPIDDIPGRKIGIDIAQKCFSKAQSYFYQDFDDDGFYNYEDCDDRSATVYPGAPELCDGLDNNCDGSIDEGLELVRYYIDRDGDGFGNASEFIDTCEVIEPLGFVRDFTDCDDKSTTVHPGTPELCDGLDNNCDGSIDEGLELVRYYIDKDGDGFGNASEFIDACQITEPLGFVRDLTDCDDDEASIYPFAIDIPDNDVDEDCTGRDASEFAFVLNDLGSNQFVLHYPKKIRGSMNIHSIDGRLIHTKNLDFSNNYIDLEIQNLNTGIYIISLLDDSHKSIFREKIYIHQ